MKDKWFPMMMEHPGSAAIVIAGTYYLIAFGLAPYMMILLNYSTAYNAEWSKWIELLFHGLSFCFAAICFHAHLAESFWNVRFYFKKYITAVVICTGLILAVAAPMQYFAPHLVIDGTLPIFEADFLFSSGAMIYYSPILGTVCATLFAPVSVGCLFYAVGFAPGASKNRWSGYLIISLVLLIPRVLKVLYFWDLSGELIIYLMQLPIHLLACWSYQKTDTVWTPITVLSITNLIACLVFIFFIM